MYAVYEGGCESVVAGDAVDSDAAVEVSDGCGDCSVGDVGDGYSVGGEDAYDAEYAGAAKCVVESSGEGSCVVAVTWSEYDNYVAAA